MSSNRHHGYNIGSVQKPKNFKATANKLVNYLKEYRAIILSALMLSAGSSTLNIFGPFLLGKATTHIFNSYTEGVTLNFHYLSTLLLFVLGLYLLSALFLYFQGYIMTGVAQDIAFKMRKSLIFKIDRLPMKYYDQKALGDTLSIISNDVDSISSTLNQSLPQIISSITTILGVLVMMLIISPSITLFTLISIPLSIFFVKFITTRSQPLFTRRQNDLGLLNGNIEEVYGAFDVIKAFHREEKAIAEFKVYNNRLYDVSWKAQFISGLIMPIMSFVTNLSYVVVGVLGGLFAVKRLITVGDIQAFIQYLRSFSMPLGQAAQIASILQSTLASAERVFTFLEEEEETPDPKKPVRLKEIKGDVEFKNVTFGYEKSKPVIKNFNLKVSPGQHIAIVGATGAGKSTLIKLLMRFYEIDSGQILIDGVDIKLMKRSDLRKIFAMVLQDTWLFNGTVMENIRYGCLPAKDSAVYTAAREAYADNFIRALPDGYSLVINEEASNISQGQMQLITIARAFISDPNILILDEATSSVDTRTEIYIQNAMDKLMKGKTGFIIAHRLSTIQDADLILVMDKGGIVERGSHKELLAMNGTYASLYNSQFRG